MDSNTEAWLKPMTLMGNHISLVPFSLDNRDDFMEATKDGELWKLWYATMPSPENIMDEINRKLNSQDKGTLLPWAIIDNNTGRAIGMTTYLNISQVDKRLDIGWTWYCNSCIQTLINVECKLLLLTYAFETLKCLTVRFGVNFFNPNNCNTIDGLCTKAGNITRNSHVTPNRTVCDFCKYSIVNSKWATVKTNLENNLA